MYIVADKETNVYSVIEDLGELTLAIEAEFFDSDPSDIAVYEVGKEYRIELEAKAIPKEE